MSYQKRLDHYFARGGIRNTPVEWDGKPADTIVVIPAINEFENIPRLLQSLALQNAGDLERTLFLFVINNGAAASDAVKDNNTRTLAFLRAFTGTGFTSAGTEGAVRVGIIDKASAGSELPAPDAGVGLARKTGMDAALTIFAQPGEQNQLICLDADCTVAANYLQSVRSEMTRCAMPAAVIQYEHPLPEEGTENHRAIICYELFLRHYTLGMLYAGSPYNFHAVGSTMAVTTDTYLKAQGMNKLKAGEDFYFLQKIAKFAPVSTINSTRVYPSARQSLRVPFGTGQRVDRFLRLGDTEYRVHDPRSFTILKDWLALLTRNCAAPAAELMSGAKDIAPELAEFLQTQKFESEWTSIQQNTRAAVKQVPIWFDGFRSMKLLHHLRDTKYPDVTTFAGFSALLELMQIVHEVPPGGESLPVIEWQKKFLYFIREIAAADRQTCGGL